MHDLSWKRDRPEEFDRGLTRRGLLPRAAEILGLDRSWRAAETRAQEAQAQRNRLSKDIGAAKTRGLDVEVLVDSQRASREAEAKERSEEHTSELQSHLNLVCRLLLEKKNREDDQES